MDIKAIIEKIKPLDCQSVKKAQERFDNLIKPVGSLAKLEKMVAGYAGIIGSAEKKEIWYPKKALLQWGTNGAKIAQAMETASAAELLAQESGVETYQLLITGQNIDDALEEGALLVKEYVCNNKLQMLAFGAFGAYEMDETIEAELQLDGREMLEKLDNPAITAMTGGILQAAALRVPIVLDGMATCLAAICATKLAPHSREYFFAGHVSAEPGMEKLLEYLNISAPLRLDINSGEGEGAILAFTLFDAGVKAYNEMETFAEAGVHAEVEEFSHAVQRKGKG